MRTKRTEDEREYLVILSLAPTNPDAHMRDLSAACLYQFASAPRFRDGRGVVDVAETFLVPSTVCGVTAYLTLCSRAAGARAVPTSPRNLPKFRRDVQERPRSTPRAQTNCAVTFGSNTGGRGRRRRRAASATIRGPDVVRPRRRPLVFPTRPRRRRARAARVRAAREARVLASH